VSEPELDSEERARRAEQALEEVLAERNRLWEELQRQRSLEQEAEYWRSYAAGIERSRWWRAGKPLRLLKRLRDDPAGTLDDTAYTLRHRDRGD
jgi:hypothetical protein